MTITLSFPDGRSVPVLGQGTWNMGDDRGRRDEEIATLRAGLDLGLRVVDTAEMYGGGRSERLVGEAIAGRRDEVFLVDKVLPSNASRRGTIEACERSLAALATDRIDLYLLHWPGSHPLSDTIEAFEELVERGLVRSWGVSNFDVDELDAIPRDAALQTDQVLYNPSRRGPEFDLFPALKARGVPAMAYSPIEQGRLLGDAALADVAARHDATVAQIALAWTIRSGDVLAIPKASSVAHVEANAAALDIRLDADDLAAIDRAFPPPRRAQPLEVI
ncbi:aldo/keto reductase [Pseudoclavibacter chungangensis]|uniref:Aldo/keto reductase n=1 Tax=Pseudoclavibacter chungangensis TaxID=587635 RepID=A0A7J5BNP2_9MICO|nr:aldo/keto reductase [Pseudoclavibacter chungangensis]KAB1654032.1 aldo/keto reductase [Pseudoclavibacter chungangensis]NYJ66061.1 diketogulonate reductase-like aldo/keto reductase [Pseudoclavibacter chungangensis]